LEYTAFLELLVKIQKPHTYVELGILGGVTFNRIAPLVERAVAVDIKHSNIVDLPHVEMYKMSTDKFAEVWSDPIDFLFIDADHRKEQVLMDFDNFSRFVREGSGLIAIHDTCPMSEFMLQDDRCSNAWEAAWEIRVNPKYRVMFEIVTLPGPQCGLSLIRKSKKQLCLEEV